MFFEDPGFPTDLSQITWVCVTCSRTRCGKSGNRVRITAQLIYTGTGAHLWADRFNGPLEDVFKLQDKVASSVAGVIESALEAAEAARSSGRPTCDLTAYDLYLRAHAMVWSARQIPEPLGLLKQAIAHDPRYSPALAWAAMCCLPALRRWLGHGPPDLKEAKALLDELGR
jgi:hypothetical protein